MPISDATLAEILRHLRPGTPSVCISRAIEELAGRPIPQSEWPPVDRTVHSMPWHEVEFPAGHYPGLDEQIAPEED